MKKIVTCFLGVLSFLGLKAESYNSVGVELFAKIIESGEVIRLDVRTLEEYTQGHIENSVNIDVLSEGFLREAAATLDKTKTVALYCRSGRRSKKAAELLSNAGYKVVELNSGYNGWVSAGMKVVK